MNDSKAVPAAGMHRAKTWEIGFYALNNTSTNTYMMMMMYVSYLVGGITVSYTHLDVYKRQRRRCSGEPGSAPARPLAVDLRHPHEGHLQEHQWFSPQDRR